LQIDGAGQQLDSPQGPHHGFGGAPNRDRPAWPTSRQPHLAARRRGSRRRSGTQARGADGAGPIQPNGAPSLSSGWMRSTSQHPRGFALPPIMIYGETDPRHNRTGRGQPARGRSTAGKRSRMRAVRRPIPIRQRQFAGKERQPAPPRHRDVRPVPRRRRRQTATRDWLAAKKRSPTSDGLGDSTPAQNSAGCCRSRLRRSNDDPISLASSGLSAKAASPGARETAGVPLLSERGGSIRRAGRGQLHELAHFDAAIGNGFTAISQRTEVQPDKAALRAARKRYLDDGSAEAAATLAQAADSPRQELLAADGTWRPGPPAR